MKTQFLTLCLSLISFLTAGALPIVVDPATPLTGTFAVEWNTAANFESWTTSGVTSATVASGSLSGTTNNTDPHVSRSNFPSGPDLDLGFNDFIELRMQVPTNYAGNVEIYYGTTATTGFDGTRVITIPNATIPKDGAFHTYRIDVGPEPWWRATLRDLQIDPGSLSGVAFSIDYLRVGDEPNATVYQRRDTTKCPAPGGTTPTDAYQGPGWTVASMESKHFRVLWNTYMTANLGWTEAQAKGTLRNLEEAWQVYVKIMGYREPAYNIGTNSGTAYKLNVTTYYDGFWAGVDEFGGTSLAQLNITPGGLVVDPPTWVIPHELMHCFQFHNNLGNMPGEWYETHANYGRERWMNHYQNVYPNRSNIEALGVRDGHFMMSSGRNYYLTWPFMVYVDTNPDALPDLSEGMIKRVWQETQPGEFPMNTLDRITPTTSLKDIAGYYARRCATWDFSNQAAMTAELNTQDPTRNARHLFTDLIQRPDAPTWWRVPLNKAPAQGAYAMHELIPTGTGAGRVVTVNLRGLADSARGADWRASLVAVSDTGVERYTPLWNTGSSSITLAANENKLYLSVAGTPDTFYYGGHDESAYRFRSHPSRSRFHYEVQVTGATPRERDNGATTGLTQHSNGGGYKSVTVPTTVYIGPNARVLGGSVSGNARIEDYAVVSGGTVNGDAIISGHAWVRGGTVNSTARVRDWAIVDGGTISGNARVLEHATVADNMQDTAVAKGSALHQSGGTLSGNAIVDGDYMFNKSLTDGVTFGHLPFVGVPDNFTTATPAGLYAAYNFRFAHDSRALDQYGITDAFTIGSPTWSATDGTRRGFLTFNGSSQSIALDRSLADSQAFTFSAWVKPAGGTANQALLWLGASTTRRMSLTASDANGKAKFSIVNGGAEQTLTASTGLAVGVWSHIAVTLNGTTGVLYVNGAAKSGSITIRPDALLAANTSTGIQQNYLARSEGSTMPMFQGSLDEVQFYSTTLSAGQITTLATPPAAVGDAMLSDSFTAESYESGTFNTNLATDQQGYLAPTTYTIAGGGGWQAQHGNGKTMLLAGDAGYHTRASLNQDFALVANEFEQPLAFQMDAWVDTGNSNSWSSVVIGNSQNISADSTGAKFAIRPMWNGSLQVWVNGSQMPLATRSGNSFRIVLSNTDGTGSAFNGDGSKAVLYNGATLIGTYTLPQLAPGDAYLTFGAQPDNGYHLTRVDNLNISRVTPPLSAYTWQGDTSTDFNTGSNYLENAWAQWTNYTFGSQVVNGTMNVDAYTGWGNISLNSGLATDIVIQSSNPSSYQIIMAPGLYAGGTITIAADSKNLTLNTDYLAANAQVWNVGAGRTLISNGSLSGWNGAAASLEKLGSGTAILGGSSSYTGTTTITDGTLQVGTGGTSGSLGSGAVSIASGAILTLNRSDAYGTGSNQVFGGAGTLVKEGMGNLVFNGTSDHTSVASLQNLTINNGLVRTDYYGQWKSDLNLIVNGSGKFEMWSTSASLGTLNGNGTVQNTQYYDRATTLTVAAGSFSGGITDNGGNTSLSFVKSGSGTLTLSAANSYTGGTTVNGGTLILGTSGTLGSGNLTVTNSAVCDLRNTSGAVANTSDVILTGSGKLTIAVGVAETVRRLYIGGVQQTSGTYTAANLPSSISGSGSLVVTEGIPAAPSGLSAATVSASAINLSWTDNATNETGYRIERSTTSGSGFTQLASLSAGATTYSDTGLSGSSTYYYRVCATNALGDSAWSGEASAATMAGTGNGVWTSLATGNWSNSGNWQNNVVADGTDATATFGQSTGVTVTLDSARTLGGLNFTTTGYTLSGSSTLTFDTTSGTPVLAVGSGASAILAVPLAGSDTLTKTGAGTLTLSGANNHSGGMTIDGGTLVATRGTLGTGAVVINNSGTLLLNDQWVFSGVNSHGVSYTNPSSLTVYAGGALQLDHTQGFANGINHLYLNGGSVSGGPNNHRGDLYLYNGNEQITAGGATTSTIASVIGLTGDNNTITVASNSTLNITSLVKNSDWASNGGGSGGLIKVGAGTLALSGANSFSGVTDITAGTLLAANNTALGLGGHRGDTMTYIRDGATLAMQGGISLDEHFHVWGSGVGGLGAVRSISGNNALTNAPSGGPGYNLRSNTTIGVDADTLTISGFYDYEGGGYSLTKVGAGTLVLSQASTYTGGTIVNEGTLIVGAGGVAKGAVTVAAGATLATTSASSTGLAVLYYNNAAIDQANIASLSALLNHFGANTTTPSLLNTAASMNFGVDGSGFPAPYNNGAANFEVFYSGKLNIVTAGIYTFNTSSDDGSMLFIDGQVVVTNNFFQGVTTRSGSIALTAGMHDIVIAFNQGGGGYGMNAQMSGPNNTNMVDINTSNANITPDLVVGSLAGAGNVTLTTGNLITGIDNASSTFSGVISGIGSVRKFGSGVLTLSGTNTYTGNTTVNAGTLRLGNGTSSSNLADTADVIVAAGAVLNLNYAGTDSIDELWLDGVRQSPGVYSAANSDAFFTGTGTLTVANGPIADPFLSWIEATWPTLADKTHTGDPDNDGISNLLEYVLQNGNPSTPNTGIMPTSSVSGTNFVFTYYRRAAASGVTQTFQYGTNLTAWTDVAIPNGSGVVITDQGSGIDRVEITVPEGTAPRIFCRLKVTPMP